MTDNAVAASVRGTAYMILVQIGSRALTFTANQIVLRHLSRELLRVSVQLELFVTTTLYLSRESLRTAAQRRSDDVQAAINLSYLAIATGVLIAALLMSLYPSGDDPQIPYHRLAFKIAGLAAMVELCSEPGFVAGQQHFLHKTRAAAEGSAIVVKSLLVFSLTLWSHHKMIDIGVLPFAIGELAHSSTVSMIYLTWTRLAARRFGFSLLPKRIASRYVL